MSIHSKHMRLWNLKFPAILLLKIAQNGNFLSVCPLGVRSFTFSSQAYETMEVTEPCLLHYKSGQVKINLSQNNLIEQIGHRRENCTRQNSSQAPLKYWNYWLKLKKKLNLLVTTHWLPIPSSLPGHAVGKKNKLYTEQVLESISPLLFLGSIDSIFETWQGLTILAFASL